MWEARNDKYFSWTTCCIERPTDLLTSSDGQPVILTTSTDHLHLRYRQTLKYQVKWSENELGLSMTISLVLEVLRRKAVPTEGLHQMPVLPDSHHNSCIIRLFLDVRDDGNRSDWAGAVVFMSSMKVFPLIFEFKQVKFTTLWCHTWTMRKIISDELSSRMNHLQWQAAGDFPLDLRWWRYGEKEMHGKPKQGRLMVFLRSVC